MHRSGVLEVPAEGTESANCPSLSSRGHTPLDEFGRRSVGGVDFVAIWPYCWGPSGLHPSDTCVRVLSHGPGVGGHLAVEVRGHLVVVTDRSDRTLIDDLADAASAASGPVVAGGLVTALGAPVAVLIDALTYLVSSAAVASIRTSETIEQAPGQPLVFVARSARD